MTGSCNKWSAVVGEGGATDSCHLDCGVIRPSVNQLIAFHTSGTSQLIAFHWASFKPLPGQSAVPTNMH